MAKPPEIPNVDHPALEPFHYTEDFESGSLRAWASYPCWQDTAYDPNFRIGEMVPGDPNRSIVQKVTPHSAVDAYAGAQKPFDAFFIHGSRLSFRYYLKTHLPFESITVRLACGPMGAVDYSVTNPPLNRWERVTVTYEDIVGRNPALDGIDAFKINAIAVLAKLPSADPAMPFSFGLDDVDFIGARLGEFRFSEPEVYTLSEWKPRIPKNHFPSRRNAPDTGSMAVRGGPDGSCHYPVHRPGDAGFFGRPPYGGMRMVAGTADNCLAGKPLPRSAPCIQRWPGGCPHRIHPPYRATGDER